MKCPVCSKDVLPGEAVQRMPPPQRVMIGQKSGFLGLYPHENFTDNQEEDIVHYPECCMGYFSPEEHPYIFDEVTEGMRQELREEVVEEVREEFRDKFERVMIMVGEQNHNFCVECWDELDGEEEPQICLWCKSPDHVWMKVTKAGVVSFCARCQKYWDEEERELAA